MKKWSLKKKHKLALLKNLSIALISNKQIKTTIREAKQLRPFVEKLITKAKIQSLAIRRFLLARLLNNNNAVNQLFEIGKLNQQRPGGYLSILKISKPNGISAALVRIVDCFTNNEPDHRDQNI